MRAKIVSLEKCKHYFDFDLLGNLYWKINVGKRGKKDSLAGFLHKSIGYYCVKIESKHYLQHRILYQLYNNKELTENDVVDHHDTNPKNNSKENLKLCDSSENNTNRKVGKNNKSTGIKNIYLQKGSEYDYYRIIINKNKKVVYSESFRMDKFTLDQVKEIRNIELKRIHGAFCNLDQQMI